MEKELNLKEILKLRKNLRKDPKESLKDVLSYDENAIFDLIISKAPSKEKLEKINTKLENSEDKNLAIKTYLEKLIKFIYKVLQKERFTWEKIEETLSQRSVFQLLLDGKVHYVNPCFDYTMVTTYILQKLWFEDVKFVIDFINNWVALHFWTEFVYNNKIYYIDSHSFNTILIWEWAFTSKYDNIESSSEKERINWTDINKDTKIFDFEKHISKKHMKDIFNIDTLYWKIQMLKTHNESWKDRTDKFVPTIKENYKQHFDIQDEELDEKKVLKKPIIKRADREPTTQHKQHLSNNF